MAASCFVSELWFHLLEGIAQSVPYMTVCNSYSMGVRLLLYCSLNPTALPPMPLVTYCTRRCIKGIARNKGTAFWCCMTNTAPAVLLMRPRKYKKP